MRSLLGLLVMLTAAPALAFEGEIEAKSLGDAAKEVTGFTMYVSKNGDVRMDTSAKGRRGKPRQVSYIKPAKGKYDYMLDHQEKQGMKIPKDTFAEAAQAGQVDEKGKKSNVEVKKLGTATIAGQSTRHVRVVDKDNGDTADFWLSDRYPAKLWLSVFTPGNHKGQSPTGEWTRVAKSHSGFEPGFIMKMLAKGERGKESGFEVTRMEEKKVAADKFAIPPGYEVATMPDMSGMQEDWRRKMQQQQR